MFVSIVREVEASRTSRCSFICTIFVVAECRSVIEILKSSV